MLLDALARAEWRGALRAAADAGAGPLAVAHAMDTAKSWYDSPPPPRAAAGGVWWDAALAELCAPYARVVFLGDSMGATAALRFARHAAAVVAFAAAGAGRGSTF